MAWKTILVPMVNDIAMRSALETALSLARRCNAYIEGFALRARIDSVALALGAIPPPNVDEHMQNLMQARAIFDGFMLEHGVPRAFTTTTSSLSFRWLNEVPEDESFVGSYGRVFDVIVMNRLVFDPTGLYWRARKYAFFESGRPLLLSPPTPPRNVATNVLIVWNASTELARTTALAMPLLKHADRVTVLPSQETVASAGQSPDHIIRYLQLHGIAAELLTSKSDQTTGRAVLTMAESLSCDLLIVGKSRGNQIQQFIYGSETKYILANALIPILVTN